MPDSIEARDTVSPSVAMVVVVTSGFVWRRKEESLESGEDHSLIMGHKKIAKARCEKHGCNRSEGYGHETWGSIRLIAKVNWTAVLGYG